MVKMWKNKKEKLQPSVCMSIFVLVCKMSQGRLGVCSFFQHPKLLSFHNIFFIIQQKNEETKPPYVSQEMQRKRKNTFSS